MIYREETSKQESYETQSYYLIEVMDTSGIFEREMLKKDEFNSIDEVMKKLYNCVNTSSVVTSIRNVIDSRWLNMHVTISDYPTSERHVKVKLTKRGLREVIADGVGKTFKKLIG
jgi:hypothetical protein